MKTRLLYGRYGLEVDIPVEADVLYSKEIAGIPDFASKIREKCNHPTRSRPLKEMLNSNSRVVVAHSDITRATPNQALLPVILDEILSAGVPREQITLICALGTHKHHTRREMEELLGLDILNNFHCIQHDAFDDSQLVSLGKTCWGNPVRVNKTFYDADVRILTGFIEPHFFAGFSGGPKCILPGLSGAESVITNHGVKMIGHPNATWGSTVGNPIWEEMLDTARKISNLFIVNVTINTNREITGVFAGDVEAAHKEGYEFFRSANMLKIDKQYDVVVATNSGYPLDQNLYQGAKGMSAASLLVRPGGAIILAAACEDGIPNGSHFEKLLHRAGSLNGANLMLAEPDFQAPDQWGVQIQTLIQQKADVYLYSDGLTDEQISKALLYPCRNMTETINQLVKKHGNRVCVLPEGPQTIVFR